jgi:hypothetical protein
MPLPVARAFRALFDLPNRPSGDAATWKENHSVSSLSSNAVNTSCQPTFSLA